MTRERFVNALRDLDWAEEIKRIDELPTRFEYAMGNLFSFEKAHRWPGRSTPSGCNSGEAVPVINVPFDNFLELLFQR